MTSKEKQKKLNQRAFYRLNYILSFQWALWYILLGARQTGKSYSVTEHFIKMYKKTHKNFYWIRLSEEAKKKLLQNNAENLVDPDLRRKYKLDLITSGDNVYNIVQKSKADSKGKCKILKKELFCKVYSFSTFYNQKGSAIFDKDALNDKNFKYCIGMDEINRESSEKNTFDICYNVVNQLENLLRNTRSRAEIIVIGNLTEDDNCSDFLSMFNFIPEEFGTYKLVKHKKELCEMLREVKHAKDSDQIREIENKYHAMFKDKNGKPLRAPFGKRAVIHYIENTDAYKDMRRGSIADMLMGDQSNFTNEQNKDTTLIYKKRLITPHYIIKFSNSKEGMFTCWDNNVITRYNNEKVEIKNMRPYLDGIFNNNIRDDIITQFDTRCFLFRNLIDFKRFQYNLKTLKPRQH